ncbi:hypothetical protein chiPu_0015418 [Chiloscyllium punctatum]|uniref:Uncharacterized protein n=1 Tax=Chiloscyllium punctatum TaxID=137246 RepID=A0A401T2R6_CHIPU|nr:hypothetical protein [Chiloscyllium punctatum]
MTTKVRALLRTRDSNLRARGNMALTVARTNLDRAIKEAKRADVQRIYSLFQDSEMKSMFKSIKAITKHCIASPSGVSDASFPDALNKSMHDLDHEMMLQRGRPFQ